LVGKPEGEETTRKNYARWEDNIRMDLNRNYLGSVDWIHLAQVNDQWWAPVNMVP
jgi:hypothetical protein